MEKEEWNTHIDKWDMLVEDKFFVISSYLEILLLNLIIYFKTDLVTSFCNAYKD